MTVERNARVSRVGRVVSDKMQKTIVVAIERFYRTFCSAPALQKRRKEHDQIQGT